MSAARSASPASRDQASDASSISSGVIGGPSLRTAASVCRKWTGYITATETVSSAAGHQRCAATASASLSAVRPCLGMTL